MFLLGSLYACVNVAAVPPTISDSHRQALYNVGSWALTGRLGVRTQDSSWHANIDWRHLAETDQLQIAGPLGRGAVQILVYSDRVEITDSNGDHQLSGNPEQVIRDQFGIPVPLSALRYWVLGLQEPGNENQLEIDANGFIRKISSQGWDIRIPKYQVSDSYTIPKKIEVERDQIFIKLIVDDWRQGV